MSYCIVIPHFNHFSQLRDFLPGLPGNHLPVIIVDDGSRPAELSALESLIAEYPAYTLIKHIRNRGKGAAVLSGIYAARAKGHTHILQIDSDGQHDAMQIRHFIEQSQQYPKAIISGAPQFGPDAPKVRVYGRKVTDFFVAIETLSLKVKDSLCGYRIYPLDQVERLIDKYSIAPRMEVDTDILVKASWENMELRFIDTKVIYPQDGVSHFNYLRDNLSLVRLHTRLLVGALFGIPFILFRRFRSTGDHS